MDTSRRTKSRAGTLSRRSFMKIGGALSVVAAAGGLEGILLAKTPPAYAQGSMLHWVRWVDFIPEADVELRRQVAEASKDLGAQIQLETINGNDIQARITASIQSGSGADIFMMMYNWPQLYANALVNVSDIVTAVEKDQGAVYGIYPPSVDVGSTWRAVPHSIVGNAIAYRKSWFKEVGVSDPSTQIKTLEDLHRATTPLKKKGRPYGQTLGHTFGDAPTWTYPVTWDFGGAETDTTGKKVVLDSKGTQEAVRFMTAFWKDSCDEGGLAWDDTGNNRAFFAQEICATLNGASIYIHAKRQKDQILDDNGRPMYLDIDHFIFPAGPVSQEQLYLSMSDGIMKYSKNQQLAKEFIRWVHQKPHFRQWLLASGGYNVGANTFWENDPMWQTIDEPLKIFRTAARKTRVFGYAGPSDPQATEAFSKYIVTDMYAKAVQGMTPKDSVAWATTQLQNVYVA